MSLDDGLFDEMRPRHAAAPMRLDEATATRLLAGRLEPADAPPGYGTVTAVLRAAAAPPRSEELAGEDAARETFRVGCPPEPKRRRAPRPRLAVLVAAGVVLLGGVAAAASTGSLPGPAQSVARDALGTLGVSVPAPHRAPPPTRTAAAPGPSTRWVPVTTAPARVPARTDPAAPHPPAPPHPSAPPPSVPPRASPSGLATALCRAAAPGHLNPHASPAMQRGDEALMHLAGSAADIPGYCRGVLTPG